MRRIWRDSSLSIVFLALFVAALVGQGYAGWHDYNDDAAAHGEAAISLGRYLVSSSFGNAVMENWQSEYLQFTLFVLLTVWFVQKGSPESKPFGRRGRQSDREQLVGEHAGTDSPAWARAGGVRLWLYSNSLLLVMATIWLGSWFAQSVTGWSTDNADRLAHGESALSYWQFLGTASFWESTLQNWQSEFLAVAVLALLTIWLRERGSAQSKPVAAPHDANE